MKNRLALTAALALMVGMTGCASTDAVKKAQATADEAKSMASQAASDAAAAQTAATTCVISRWQKSGRSGCTTVRTPRVRPCIRSALLPEMPCSA